MTVREAMEQIDELHPNQFSQAQKLRWLTEVEQTIWRELSMRHEQDEETEMPVYDDATSETVLLAPDPYSRIYRLYLDAQIYYNNQETLRYNDAAATYNAAWQELASWWNRTYMPRQQATYLRLM